ncbi:MAG: VC0807 family protein [Bacteroidales bacterium]
MAHQKKRENVFLSLLFNIAAPVLIMTKLSSNTALGPVYGLVVALAFPIVYALYDFITRSNVNIISILGFTSILLTGVFGLFELSPMWIAVKEASVPLIIGLIVLFTIGTEKNLVTKILFNEDIMDLSKVHKALDENQKNDEFKQLVVKSSYWVAASFFLSSVLNFVLARIVLTSPPGTTAYVEELGRMNALSFPVIALPSTAILIFVLFNIFKHIKRLTGYSIEDIMVTKK